MPIKIPFFRGVGGCFESFWGWAGDAIVFFMGMGIFLVSRIIENKKSARSFPA